MEFYTPDVIEEQYARFLVRLDVCPECGRYMVTVPQDSYGTFPYGFTLCFTAQAKAAGFGIKSGLLGGDNFICTDCATIGKAWFTCYHCQEKKSSDKMYDSFGDPPDYLCTDCYETVPAKEWNEIIHRLNQSHQYDFSG
jgi:hypothetical protein